MQNTYDKPNYEESTLFFRAKPVVLQAFCVWLKPVCGAGPVGVEGLVINIRLVF